MTLTKELEQEIDDILGLTNWQDDEHLLLVRDLDDDVIESSDWSSEVEDIKLLVQKYYIAGIDACLEALPEEKNMACEITSHKMGDIRQCSCSERFGHNTCRAEAQAAISKLKSE